MSSFFRSRRVLLVLALVASMFLVLGTASVQAKKNTDAQTVVDVEFLGLVTFDTGFEFDGTEVGGLSGITYDPSRGVYYALSDDRSQTNPARYYTVDIDIADGTLDGGDVTFVGVSFLTQGGATFPPGSVDPEGIELTRPGHLYISSEGDADAPVIDPFVNRFSTQAKQTRALPVPDKFLPDGTETFGVRDNLAFESLTSTPDRGLLYTATENALVQDGPASTLALSSPSRLLEYSLSQKRPGAEYVYLVDPIPFDSDPPGIFADNGLVELQALDNYGTFLAMERSFAVGVGNTVKLFETSTSGATDVSGIEALPPLPDPAITEMSKALVADLADLGIDPDNLEGMTFGPPLADGRRSLILVSDNNFNPFQITQFILLAVELEPA